MDGKVLKLSIGKEMKTHFWNVEKHTFVNQGSIKEEVKIPD